MVNLRGRVSWFGGPHDPMSGPLTASGYPTSTPGIAVYDHTTLLGDWRVTFPNGRSVVLRQTDFGPAPWTGRVLDVLYSALEQCGYTERDFPTDATITAEFLGKPMLGDSPLVTYYRQAQNYHAGGNLPIDHITLHDMEYPERPTGAEWCADFFGGPGAPQASCHYMGDSDSITQGVREQDVAWHAPPNAHSIGIEHAGYMAQSRSDWLDAYSLAELRMTAKLTAELCRRHNLPVVFLRAADLRAGKRGITTHAEVSAAFRQTDHGDPGAGFPIDLYLRWVNDAMAGHPAEEDEDMEILFRAKGTASVWHKVGSGRIYVPRFADVDAVGIPKTVHDVPADHYFFQLPVVGRGPAKSARTVGVPKPGPKRSSSGPRGLKPHRAGDDMSGRKRSKAKT